MPGSMDRLSPSVAGMAGRQRLFVHRMATDRIVHWRTVAMPASRTRGRPGCREEAVVFFVSGDWGEEAGDGPSVGSSRWGYCPDRPERAEPEGGERWFS